MACLQKEVGDSVKKVAAMASPLRALPHRNMDGSFHLASISLRLVRNTTKFPRAILRPAQCPGDPVPARWLAPRLQNAQSDAGDCRLVSK